MKKIILGLFIILLSINASAEKGHEESGEEDHHEDAAEKGHGDHQEENSSIGPGKGITEKGKLGLKFSEEALKTYDYKAIEIKSKTIEIPEQGLVKVKAEKSVFRIRDGWFKRIPVRVLQKGSGKVTINSEELVLGDQIVIEGAGFLRTAEVFSEEGAEHSH